MNDVGGRTCVRTPDVLQLTVLKPCRECTPSVRISPPMERDTCKERGQMLSVTPRRYVTRSPHEWSTRIASASRPRRRSPLTPGCIPAPSAATSPALSATGSSSASTGSPSGDGRSGRARGGSSSGSAGSRNAQQRSRASGNLEQLLNHYVVGAGAPPVSGRKTTPGG